MSADFLPLQVSGATAALALDKVRLYFFSKLSVAMAIGKVILSPLLQLIEDYTRFGYLPFILNVVISKLVENYHVKISVPYC